MVIVPSQGVKGRDLILGRKTKMKIWNCSVFPLIKSAHRGYRDQVIVILGTHLRILGTHLRINFEIFFIGSRIKSRE